MPIVRVINTDFTPCAYLDSCTSIQWTRKMWEIGTFEIHCSLNKDSADQLIKDNIVFLSPHRAGIIDSYYKQKTNKGNEIVATGKEIKDMCRWRLTVPGQLEDTQYFGYDRYPDTNAPDVSIETIMKHYIDHHMVHPDEAYRVIPDLITAANQERGALTRWQSRFEFISDVFKNIGETYGVGYEIYLDLDNSKYVFDVISGNDHTSDSTSPVVFAASFSNITSLKYTENKSAYKNAGYAGGSGEDEGRLIQIVYENDSIVSGFDRREIFLDCGSIDALDDLMYEGKYKLQSYVPARSLTGDIVQNGPFAYLKDWDLGDYVTLQSKDFDVEVDEQITEVKEVYEKGKTTVTPTFGKRNRNIVYDEIRKYGTVR